AAILKGHTSRVENLAFSSDNRRVVSGALDGVRVWDRATGKLLRRYPEKDGQRCWTALSEDGRLALVSLPDVTRRFDTETGEVWGEARFNVRAMNGLAPVGKGDKVLVWGSRAEAKPADPTQPREIPTVWLCDAQPGRILRSFDGPDRFFTAASVSPDGRLAASAAQDGTIYVWDLVGKGPPPAQEKP